MTYGFALLLALLFPATLHAQDASRAGLVIIHGDGSVTQQCVPFAEESISGYELLQRAGAALSVEAGGMGATVCSIDGEGCSYPAESCFCQCQSSPCVYWSYWRLEAEGGWRYQPLGAGNTQVRNGDVEAWRWAAGTRQDAPAPPAVRFAEICTLEAQVTRTADGAADGATDGAAAQMSGDTSAAGVQPAGSAAATATTATSAATSGMVEPEDEQVGMWLGGLWLVLGAVLLLPVAGLLIWARLRRRPGKE